MSWTIGAIYTCAVCGKDVVCHCDRCRDRIVSLKWPGVKHEPHVEG